MNAVNTFIACIFAICFFITAAVGNEPVAPVAPQKAQDARISPDYWAMFNERIANENKRYAEENPSWPKGEPAPVHIAKKALTGINGRNLLDGLREGVVKMRELYRGLPQEEQDYKLELEIEHVLTFFPLLETNPKGHMALFNVIANPNTDPIYRNYLIKRTYKSEMPETLFSQYLQDACVEDNGEIMKRLSTVMLEKSVDPQIQIECLKAFIVLTDNMVVHFLEQDREVVRVAEKNDYKINVELLTEHPEIRMLDNTPDLIGTTLSRLDELLLKMQKHFNEESTRPDWLKKDILDAMEIAIEKYALDNEAKHREFLISQGRDVRPPSLEEINAGNEEKEDSAVPVEIIALPDN